MVSPQSQGRIRGPSGSPPAPLNHSPVLPIKGLVEGGSGHPDADPHPSPISLTWLGSQPVPKSWWGQMKWGVNGAVESSEFWGSGERSGRGEAHLASGVSHPLQSLLERQAAADEEPRPHPCASPEPRPAPTWSEAVLGCSACGEKVWGMIKLALREAEGLRPALGAPRSCLPLLSPWSSVPLTPFTPEAGSAPLLTVMHRPSSTPLMLRKR